MHYISDVLYWISTGLLVPVVLLLIYLFCRALLMMGGFIGQYLDAHRIDMRVEEWIDGLSPDSLEALFDKLPSRSRSLFVRSLKALWDARAHAPHREKILADFETAADKDLAPAKILGKMGPLFGLMGTLIPMGPALVGLSTGDIASMAYNMQVAFATTVVGLFSSAVGFATQQVKRRWYVRQMDSLAYVDALLKETADTSR